MRIAYYTLGCKVNQYDTQMMKDLLEAEGHTSVPFQEPADCFIINTCSVTNMSDKKSKQMISRCKRNNPDAIIVVCGCFSQISPKDVAAIDGVDIVLGTANRKHIVSYLNEYLNSQRQIVATAALSEETKLCGEQIHKFENKTRAILKIEDGCRNFCSYCLIPFARGQIRSKPLDDISKELAALSEQGYKEIVLTGIHLASYGKDLDNCDLADAIKLTCNFGFQRVRLGSLEPIIITEEFLAKISKYKNLMPSFHLSLQSGCDSVLSRMNRHYNCEQYAHSVKLLKEYFPDCAVTTDIIVGFPGETEKEFQDTLKFANQIGFSKIHIFPFSPRQGTKAANMENQVPSAVKTERSKRLQEIEYKCRNDFMNAELGKTVSVLFEQKKNGCWEGYTENYLPVRLTSNKNLEDILLDIKITDANGEYLIAEEL